MARMETWFEQDLKKPLNVRMLTGNLFSMDNEGNLIGVTVTDGGEPADLAGDVSANVIRADGGTVAVEGNLSGNEATVVLPQAAYAIPGLVTIIIKLTDSDSGVITTLAAMTAIVYRTSTDTVVDPGTIVSSIQTLIDTIETTAATIPLDYTALNDAVEELTGVTFVSTWVDGYAYKTTSGLTITPGSPVTNSSYTCTYAACQEGDVFTLDIYNGATSNYRPWCFIDSSGNQLKKATNNSGRYKNVEITAPENAAYLVVNANKSNLPHYVYKGRLIPPQLDEKQNKLTFDEFAKEDSENPVKSGGVYDDIMEIRNDIGFTDTEITLTDNSNYYWNAETSTAVKTAYTGYKAYDAVDVEAGETYRVKVYEAGSDKQYPVLLVDDDYTIIGHYGGHSLAICEYVFKIPSGVTKILVTTSNSRLGHVYKRTLKPIPDNIFRGTMEFEGKNIAIIGDSISTNGDYSASNLLGNVPEIVIEDADVNVELSAYVTYYDVGTTVGGHEITEAEVGTEITFTPAAGDVGKIVGKPKNNNAASVKTWWEVAQEILKFNVIPVCWSGSSITSHEDNVQEDGHYIYKTSYAWHPAQIRKCGIRTPGSMTRTAPDVIIIYRGTNDLTHSPYSRITDYMDSYPTAYPEGDTYDDNGTTRFDYAMGMRLLIKKLRDAYPAAQIVLCTLNYFRRLSTTAKYTTNGTNNWQQYNAMIRRIAEHEGCGLIEFDRDGLTWSNAADDYYQEGSSSTAKWTHPTTKGHKVLGNRALIDLRNMNDMT